MVPHSHITSKASVSGSFTQYTLDQIKSSKQEPLKLWAIRKETSSAILKGPEHRLGEQRVPFREKSVPNTYYFPTINRKNLSTSLGSR